MRKPKLELRMQDKINNLIAKERLNKRRQILRYCVSKLHETFDYSTSNLFAGYEPVKNYSIEIYTVRAGDTILFREFPDGSLTYGLVDRRYEIYV